MARKESMEERGSDVDGSPMGKKAQLSTRSLFGSGRNAWITGITYQHIDNMDHACTCGVVFLFPVRVDAGRRAPPANPSLRGGQDAGGCGRVDGRNRLVGHLDGGKTWVRGGERMKQGTQHRSVKRGLDLPVP